MYKKIITLVFCVYLISMGYYFYTHQYYNADIEAYMGLVYKANFPDMKIEEIHKKVYDEIKDKNPKLTQASHNSEETALGQNTYYNFLSEHPKAYEEELQLFTVKPLYNFINSIFFKLGAKTSTSTFLVTIISYIAIILLVYFFLLHLLKNHYLAIIFSVLISLFKPLLDASRHASPDVLSCLLLLLSFYFFIKNKNIFLSTIFGMLCILTRPDYFIFYVLILAFIYIFNKKYFQLSVKELILSLVYMFLSFFLVQYFNQISWSVLFMNQFTKVQLFPISQPDHFYFIDYVNYIKRKIFFEFNSSFFLILFLFIVLSLVKLYYQKNKKFIFYSIFFFLIYTSVFIRFLIFPTLVNRMMIGYYLIIIVGLIILNVDEKLIKKSQ